MKISRLVRRPGVWIVLLCTVVVAGDRLLAAGLGRLLLRSQARISIALRGGGSSKLLVVGNSRGRRGLPAESIASRTGAATFNLCVNGASMELVEVLLAEYLDRNQRPDLVILEPSALLMSNRHLEELTPYLRYSDRLRSLLAEHYPATTRACAVSHLYALNSPLFRRSLLWLGRSDEEWVLHGRISQRQLSELEGTPPFARRSDVRNRNALIRMIRWTGDAGLRLRVVVAPFLPPYLAKWTDSQEWLDDLRSVAGSAGPVWDYSSAIAEPALFRDSEHLNHAGTERWVQLLVDDGFFAETTSP